MGIPAPVGAATFSVTKTDDTADGACDADCSLREAVIASNALPGADEIVLEPLTYPLTLRAAGAGDTPESGDLDIADDLVVRPRRGRAVIDGNGRTRLFQVAAGATVELRRLELVDGYAHGRGAAIHNAGTLALRQVAIGFGRLVENRGGVIEGGGIYNAGTLTVTGSRIHHNVAMGGPALLAGGRGGALYNAAGAQLQLRSTRIDDNWVGLDDANGYGGGLYNAGDAVVERSVFIGNDPGGGEGSAIANRAGATLRVVNSTFSGNGHDGATGAISNGTRQQAPEAPSTLALLHVTIADNNGGGLYNAGSADLRNVIIGGNYVADGPERNYSYPKNCLTEPGAAFTQRRSIMADTGTCPAWRTAANASFLDTELMPLSDHGAIDAVHLPRLGGGAIDTAAAADCTARDQLGHERPVDGDGDGTARCDVGAVELQPGAQP